MKRVADKAYWIYAAGVTGSVALAFFTISQVQSGGRAVISPMVAGLSAVELALIVMTLVLAYGLFVAMPVLRREYAAQAELTDRAAELEVAVVTDPLTGLHNRRYFEDALQEYVTEFTKLKAPLAVLTLDLDHFKSVNDTYGHAAGDVVLQQLSNRLKSLVREHDVVARTGGEEFCIIAPFSAVEQIRPFAERICRMVGEMRVDLGHVVLRPTISIGVASSAEGLVKPEDLIRVSDERLYLAKEQGRNRVAC